MFIPKYQVLIKDENFFPKNNICCLGTQLAILIKLFAKILPSHFWYAADVTAISPLPNELDIDSMYLKKVGDDLSLIEICNEIDQFLSGVFLAIDIKHAKIAKIRVGTEDKKYRPIQLHGIFIEIRTFDTSYFEIYAENEEYIKVIADYFNVKIEKYIEESAE